MSENQIWVINVANREQAIREIQGVGSDAVGCRLMAPKAVHRVVKITGLSPVQANIIKQEMLARGGDAALTRGSVNMSVNRTDVLVMGTLRQLRGFTAKLRMQPFGLPALADRIEAVLCNLEKTRVRRLDCRGHELALGARTLVMGILNITPDSFSDGGRYNDAEEALRRARQMIAEGADIIDVGGESTRPGSETVSAEDEWRRIGPVLERLVPAVDVPVSVDTSKVAVAQRALELGVHIVNDQWALADSGMAELVSHYEVPVILMHNQQGTDYLDLLGNIVAYFEASVEKAKDAGIRPDKIILDPGFGFGKTVDQNLDVIRRFGELRSLGFPLLIGTSRKSTIGKVLDLPIDQRVEGTAATVAVGIANGADLVRVHDVREMVRVARMTDAIVRGWSDAEG
ncbi:MAG: dihydropteroate synthase [Clostridia bacterium]|nr:dihydropteroate synthase [Clostridia bacterium]MDQ7791889.1 dihydropteroate synthase [Clostridia bacterium]